MRILILFLILGSSFGYWEDHEKDEEYYEWLREWDKYYDEYDYNRLDLNISEEAAGMFSFLLMRQVLNI